MSKPIDLTGQRFGLLSVLAFVEHRDKHSFWRCRCDCGKTTTIRSNSLRRGLSTSCGCRRTAHARAAKTTHGLTGAAEYRVWLHMKERCLNRNDKSFQRYGGRGIRVCERWLSFDAFFADMGRRPSPRHSIDRVDNDGNYEAGNCRWATQEVQQRNRRDTIRVTVGEEALSLADACASLGAPYHRVRGRMHRGWSFDRAVTEPAHFRG